MPSQLWYSTMESLKWLVFPTTTNWRFSRNCECSLSHELNIQRKEIYILQFLHDEQSKPFACFRNQQNNQKKTPKISAEKNYCDLFYVWMVKKSRNFATNVYFVLIYISITKSMKNGISNFQCFLNPFFWPNIARIVLISKVLGK